MAVIQSGNSVNTLRVNDDGQALVATSPRDRTGVYIAMSGLLTVAASAHAATAGWLWLLNPLTSGVYVALRRMEVTSNSTGTVTTITRATLERMTFTGTPTATPIPVAKVETAMPAPIAMLLPNIAGITPTSGPGFFGFQMVSLPNGGPITPVMLEYEPEEHGEPVLAPGEGFVFRQADNGTAGDPRKVSANLAWEEFA